MAGTGPGHRQSKRRALVVATVAAGLLAGCAEHEDHSLCVSYAEYVAIADQAYAADVTAATASDVVDGSEVLLGEVAQLRAAADSRYRAPIDRLEELLEDLERTVGSLQDDADYSTWRPLVDDTLDDIRIADDRLRRVVDPACAARFADGDV